VRKPLDVMRIRPDQIGRYDPVSNTFGMVRVHRTRAHQGWDLVATPGTRAFAICEGELSHGFDRTGYGHWAQLKFTHNGKTYFAFYGHLQGMLLGDASVREGTPIALTGRSGNASKIPEHEAHLHFEIRTIPNPGHGLPGRIDPGQILGYGVYSC
jgi:murein DD-endopeptidase MepM/ murein hydrolase activator NlpD